MLDKEFNIVSESHWRFEMMITWQVTAIMLRSDTCNRDDPPDIEMYLNFDYNIVCQKFDDDN